MNTRKQHILGMELSGRQAAWVRSWDACRQAAAKCGRLRDRLMKRIAAEFSSGVSSRMLQQAIREAEAVADTTPFPLLFLPALAEEKARNAWQWERRQHAILERQKVLAK
jgi:hypothetical protein